MAGLNAFFGEKPVSSNGLVASAVLKTSQGRLFWVYAYNNNAAARYLMIFDAIAVPSNGNAPLLMQQIPAQSSTPKELNFQPSGLQFVNGLVFALSSTAATLTIAAADLTFTAGMT